MNKIILAAAAGVMTLSVAACNTPGERALGGAAIGGLAGATIGGIATGHTGGALAGAAVGAAGGAVVGAATTPEPVVVGEAMPAGPAVRTAPPQGGHAPVYNGVNPGSPGRANQGSQGWSPKDCKYGTMMHHGSLVCSP